MKRRKRYVYRLYEGGYRDGDYGLPKTCHVFSWSDDVAIYGSQSYALRIVERLNREGDIGKGLEEGHGFGVSRERVR